MPRYVDILPIAQDLRAKVERIKILMNGKKGSSYGNKTEVRGMIGEVAQGLLYLAMVLNNDRVPLSPSKDDGNRGPKLGPGTPLDQ